MKKTITLLFAGLLTLGMSAQNFGLGFDYMMLSGTMVEGEWDHDSDTTTLNEAIPGGSSVLALSYDYAINDDMTLVGSVGYGMGFTMIPMKLALSYGLTSSISANLGMGLYMISHGSFDPQESDDSKGSKNEAGYTLGLKYHMNNIGVGLGYEMIRGGEIASVNAFTIGLSYTFGGGDSEGDSSEE